MNIFVLDKNTINAARMQCDKHVVKMVTEAAQMLSNAFDDSQRPIRLRNPDDYREMTLQFPDYVEPYRRCYLHHPCSRWATRTYGNFMWLLLHGIELGRQYDIRYDKVHRSTNVLNWILGNMDLANIDHSSSVITMHPQMMPDELMGDDVVEAYRRYYIRDKARFAKWNKGVQAPSWWNIAELHERRI